MSVRLPAEDGTFIQMEDEIASLGAVIGASLAGVKSMTATSGPGFSLMQENLGFACVAEVPCVIVDLMRAGPSTGLPTNVSQGDVMQARWGTHGDHPIIVLSPHSVRETFDLTVTAVNFSEKYRLPVILLMDEVIGHMRRALARDLGPEVRVNGVAPGTILWPDDETWRDEVARQRIINQSALKRIGEPDDIARAVQFLLAEAPYVTGQILAVDGGRSISL